MMGPLRYITTKQEYSEMVMKENKKLAIDDFWLKITGTTERGKKVIKKFYTRVQLANKNFSSYKEGWKSDRGMVYIIYGPPDVVYKNNFSESWIYGEEGNLISLNFTFVKIRNPFTDNDFSLDRSPIYKNSWYLAVDAWRQGIIY
jgi:GWxTD domain-containing protein